MDNGQNAACSGVQAVNWLRSRCVDGLAALVADEPGLGKTATVVAFIQSLRHEFKSPGPVLVVVPPASLSFWEGEFAFWAGKEVNVVSFAGSSTARSIIHDHEMWLTPGSMDGRSTFNIQNGLPAKASPFPDTGCGTLDSRDQINCRAAAH